VLDELGELLIGEGAIEFSFCDGIYVFVEEIEEVGVRIGWWEEAHIMNPIESIHHAGIESITVSLTTPSILIVSVFGVPASPVMAMSEEGVGTEGMLVLAAGEQTRVFDWV